MVLFMGCVEKDANIIDTINIGLHANNRLKIQIDIATAKEATVFVEYWPEDKKEKHKIITPISTYGLKHMLVLSNIVPLTNYTFQVVTSDNVSKKTSKPYHFKSQQLPSWLQNQFKANYTQAELIPDRFKEGYILLSKRETPGVAYLIDYNGNLRWYHSVDGVGFKVSRFTEEQNIISILGKNDEPTSYGSEILEINLAGDTLVHLQKGQEDFKYTIHHEIIKKSPNELVTIFVDEKVMDLRSIGGKEKDTIVGDGILILDKKGKEIWKWSVFDTEDPLKDINILENKKDWVHANSLNYDTDGNFIISFYNNGQIWKVDSKSGEVIWKLGKGGTLKMSSDANFSQAHAAHINQKGELMFFDNGVEVKQSSVFRMDIDDKEKTAHLKGQVKLPLGIYNERMGSAYMVDDETVLACASKRHSTVLVNSKGDILWTLVSNIPPYRAQFIPGEKLKLN
ncbi:aryl-sulfate sulfotransferase [Arenibacter sp. F26102]|nr:aryl-sulfate sulfotransferase [Arenibacter sp. F26102]